MVDSLVRLCQTHHKVRGNEYSFADDRRAPPLPYKIAKRYERLKVVGADECSRNSDTPFPTRNSPFTKQTKIK